MRRSSSVSMLSSSWVFAASAVVAPGAMAVSPTGCAASGVGAGSSASEGVSVSCGVCCSAFSVVMFMPFFGGLLAFVGGAGRLLVSSVACGAGPPAAGVSAGEKAAPVG